MGARDLRPGKRRGREYCGAKIAFIFLLLIGALLQSQALKTRKSCRRPIHDANVAVLLYGQARTLNRTHCSITEHILEPLLNASHNLHVFVLGESDGDSWQYEAYLHQLLKRGIRYHIETQHPRMAATKCAMALDNKYEARMQRLMKEYNTYAAELLTHLKYRESVNSLRKEFEKTGITFDVVILARPDVVYTSPLPPLCHFDDYTVQVPPWQSYGGINDRFLIARNGPALDHYLGLHSGLCDRGFVTKLPWRRRGLNAERIYAWWLRQGDFRVEKWYLKRFVFYRLRRGAGLSESPDADFGQCKGATVFNGKYNPSSVPWSSVVDSLSRCPPLEGP